MLKNPILNIVTLLLMAADTHAAELPDIQSRAGYNFFGAGFEILD